MAKKGKATLDKIDIEILRCLQEDCTLQYKQIAEKVGSPTTTVYSKIKRMKESGIIKSCKAILDHDKLGLDLTAFIFLTYAKISKEETETKNETETERKSAAIEAADKLKKYDGVQEVHILAGPWDVLVKVKIPDRESLSKLVLDEIREMGDFDKSMTSISLETRQENIEILLEQALLSS